jgi:hypothetical protein
MTSREKLSGQLFNIRLGPFVEWNLTPKLTLATSGGGLLMPGSVDYDFTETTLLAGGGVGVTTGHSSRAELLYGFYAGATFRYDFSNSWSAYLGGRFQSLNSLEQTVAGRTARLDQNATLHATVGVSYRF